MRKDIVGCWLGALALVVVLIGGCSSEDPEGDVDAGVDVVDDVTADADADSDVAEDVVPLDYCDGETPDADCYRERRDPDSENIELALAIARRQIELLDPTEVPWDWGESVLMFGMVELYRVTGETDIRDFYQAWMDHHIENGYDLTVNDRVPPAITALALYQELGDETYRDVIDDVMVYLFEEAARTEEGGISHMGVLDAVFGETLWLDSLFMFGNILNRWTEETGEAEFIDEYAEQFVIFTDLLQDESGWMTHAYNWNGAMQDEGVFWARGNSWVTAATFEYLRVRRIRGERDDEALSRIIAHLDAAVAAQDAETGLWWTLPSHPGEGYLETSAAALWAYAIARGYRYGWLDDTYLDAMNAAMDGVRSRIVDSGEGPVVTGTSGPTSVGDRDYYLAVPQGDDISYGVGATILALVETSGL